MSSSPRATRRQSAATEVRGKGSAALWGFPASASALGVKQDKDGHHEPGPGPLPLPCSPLTPLPPSSSALPARRAEESSSNAQRDKSAAVRDLEALDGRYQKDLHAWGAKLAELQLALDTTTTALSARSAELAAAVEERERLKGRIDFERDVAFDVTGVAGGGRGKWGGGRSGRSARL